VAEQYTQLPLFDIDEPEQEEAAEKQPESLHDFSDEVLRRRLELLSTQNRAKVQQLLSDGRMPDPRSVLTIRLDTVLALIFTPSEKLRFEVLFETRMSAFLDQCLAESSRANLLTPLNQPCQSAPGGLILPPR